MKKRERLQDITRLNETLTGKTVEETFVWAMRRFGATKIAFASSLGVEDQVITHILRKHFPEIVIFTIDTGRLAQETYDLIQKTSESYRFQYEVLYPDVNELDPLVTQHGPNLFYKSIDLRKACCHARKVVPLQKKLTTLDAWICGLRRVQSVTRVEVDIVEWDEAHGLVKINPLVSWSDDQVWTYIKENKVPYNALHDQGFPSIGCVPCTRAIKSNEDMRAGRWWWELPEHKECGLHARIKKG